MAIAKHHKRNFETLGRAFDAERVVILEVRERATGQVRVAVCTVSNYEDGKVGFMPFAVLVEGNPFELFDPPNPDEGFFDGQSEGTEGKAK